jgi:hypothetical protein
MYSRGSAALRSSASAGRPKSAFQRVVVMNWSSARTRVGRAVEESEEEAALLVVVLRVARRSRRRRPSG